MKKELSDYEKIMYKFAYESALKGIDIEETLGIIWNISKEVSEIVTNLTNKNYEYLKKCKKNSNNLGDDDCEL